MGTVNSRAYHGQKKRKVIGIRTLAADPGTSTIVVDAGQGDLFSIVTDACGCGALDLTWNIINAHDGQTVWIRYDSNDTAADPTVVIQLDGTGITFTEPTVDTVGDHIFEIKIFDASDAATVVVADTKIT